MVVRRSVSEKWENRATSDDCRPNNRPKSAPIFCRFMVGRRFFCRSTQVKSFVDRFTDFQGFCHRWGVGHWSPDDRPTVGRHFKEIYITKSAEGRPIIGRQSDVDRPTVGRWHFIKEPSADRRRYRPSFGRWSLDCRPIINGNLCYIVYNACVRNYYESNIHAFILFRDSFHSTSCTSNIWFLWWISYWIIHMRFRNKSKYFTLNIATLFWTFSYILRMQSKTEHSLIYELNYPYDVLKLRLVLHT